MTNWQLPPTCGTRIKSSSPGDVELAYDEASRHRRFPHQAFPRVDSIARDSASPRQRVITPNLELMQREGLKCKETLSHDIRALRILSKHYVAGFHGLNVLPMQSLIFFSSHNSLVELRRCYLPDQRDHP